jgi:hypothetical protein
MLNIAEFVDQGIKRFARYFHRIFFKNNSLKVNKKPLQEIAKAFTKL